MPAIAEFLATIGFETDKPSLKEALKTVASFGSAVAVAAGGAIAAILKIADSERQLADDSKNLGVPADRLEELRFVAEQTGTSAEALTSSLQGLKKANPQIRDTSQLLEKAGKAIRGMSDSAASAYAQKMGIDPELIPMLREDVAGLANDYKELYAASGRNAAESAANGKAVIQEYNKLKGILDLVVKSVAGAFLGKVRASMEILRKMIMENFQKIRIVLETLISIVLRLGNMLFALVHRLVKFASSIVTWFDRLDAGQKKVVIGIGLIAAAWKLLSAGFLATPIGVVISALTTLFLLIDDYLTWSEGGDSKLDWSEHAESIKKVIEVVKFLWNIICALGAGIAQAIDPAIDIFKNLFSTVWDIVRNIAILIAGLFTGDISQILESAKGIWQAYSNGVINIFRNLVKLVVSFFSGMWTSICQSFPDFAAWAKKAGDSIKNFFGKALGWVKEKLASLTGLLPDWLKEKLGIGKIEVEENNQESDQQKPAQPVPPAVANIRPVPSGPMLKPSPVNSETKINKNTEIKVDSKTEITVNGAQNPEAVAGKVNSAQDSFAADIARHTQGAVR